MHKWGNKGECGGGDYVGIVRRERGGGGVGERGRWGMKERRGVKEAGEGRGGR